MPARFFKFLPLLLLLGCGGLSKEGEVTGTVKYQGKPLPGGVVTFINDRGLQNTAIIDANGSYQIKVAVGPTKVRIDNRMLSPDSTTSPRLKPPAASSTPALNVQGTYVPLPLKYLSGEGSGLHCDVRQGTQTVDFELSLQ